MASLVKTTILKVANPVAGKLVTCVIQHRGINGRALRESLPKPPPKPKPFDYVNKDYSVWRSTFDRTSHRLDENSKVVVVEGPVAAGKTQFASMLADDLGMKHFPEANMDLHYILPNGIDLRIFDSKVPEDTRCFDHKNFCMAPNDRLAGAYQLLMYNARYGQYIDALAHLLNTGQGVVLERSPYSDFVFLEAMFLQGYISKGVRSVYHEIVHNTITELMQPHLVIYLDIPVNRVQELIKQRNFSHEVKGKALTEKYLAEIEKQYKNKYLREISKHAELLVYDWSAGGQVDVVVEDIERIDFNKYVAREEPKMKDWRMFNEVDWADRRMCYTNQKHYYMNLFCLPRIDVPELLTSADDAYEHEKVLAEHPDFQYENGYNQKDGASWFKSKMSKYTEYL